MCNAVKHVYEALSNRNELAHVAHPGAASPHDNYQLPVRAPNENYQQGKKKKQKGGKKGKIAFLRLLGGPAFRYQSLSTDL